MQPITPLVPVAAPAQRVARPIIVAPGIPAAPVIPSTPGFGTITAAPLIPKPLAPLNVAIPNAAARPVAPVAPVVAAKAAAPVTQVRPLVAPITPVIQPQSQIRPAVTPVTRPTIIRPPTTQQVALIAPVILNAPMATATPIGGSSGGGIMGALARGRVAAPPTAIAVQTAAVAAPQFTITQENEETLLNSLSNVWQHTPQQIQILLNIRYQDGNNIITLTRRDIIMEIIGMILRNDFESTIDFINNAANPGFILWDQAAMDDSRDKLAREISVQQIEEIGITGVGKCRYCQSKELKFSMKQLSSGDEPMAIFVRCVLCGKQWRQ